MQSLQSGVSKNYFQNSYQVSQCKQKIATLQKQINVQQALLFKQQMQPQPGNRPNNQMLNNSIGNNLANDLSNLQLNQQQQNQSRLNQWKLPSNYDKDDLTDYDAIASNTPNDFSRAPGPSKQQQFISPPNSWTNAMTSGGDESGWQNKNQLPNSVPPQQQQQLINPNNNYGEMVGADFGNKWKDTMQQMNNNPQAAFCDLSGDVKEQMMYNWSANKLVDNENLANASNTFNSSTWTFSNTNAQLAAAAAATPQNANIWNNNNNQSANTANNNKPTKGPPPGLGQVQQQQQQQKDQNSSSFILIRNLTMQVSWLKVSCPFVIKKF